MPPITQALLGLNIIGFALQEMLGRQFEILFALWPIAHASVMTGEGPFELWQILTYAFLHGSYAHLGLNMIGLWMFGREIEVTFGSSRYLQYYLSCVVTAALAQLAVTSFAPGPPAPTVGASGGVFGLLLAFGMMFPTRRVMLLIPPIPMQARTLVILFGIVELVLGITGTASGVAHFAHLGGLVGGFFLIQYWRGRWPFGRG